MSPSQTAEAAGWKSDPGRGRGSGEAAARKATLGQARFLRGGRRLPSRRSPEAAEAMPELKGKIIFFRRFRKILCKTPRSKLPLIKIRILS